VANGRFFQYVAEFPEHLTERSPQFAHRGSRFDASAEEPVNQPRQAGGHAVDETAYRKDRLQVVATPSADVPNPAQSARSDR
jgi:hypothetical protein